MSSCDTTTYVDAEHFLRLALCMYIENNFVKLWRDEESDTRQHMYIVTDTDRQTEGHTVAFI